MRKRQLPGILIFKLDFICFDIINFDEDTYFRYIRRTPNESHFYNIGQKSRSLILS